MTATITDALRPYKGAIMALVTATKPDGSKWTYKEILRDLGMPVSNAYERAVSKMVNKEGLRRRADFKRSKPDDPGELLGIIEGEEVDVEVPQDVVDTAMLRDIHRKIFDCMTALSDAWKATEKAIQELNVEWWRMVGAVGIKSEDAND